MNKVDESLMTRRLIEQTLTNWVNPELERRKTSGQLVDKFVLKAAQVIFSVDGSPVVRVNHEVKAIIEAKINRRIEKGENIFDKDIEDIRSIKLSEDEVDFGHITIIRLPKGWFVGFSFIYDVSKSKIFYDIAIEFMKSAYDDLQQKRYRPFVECLSVAAENLVKARIYLLPDKEIRKAKKHGALQSKVNVYARTNSIIKTEQKDAFNNLMRTRDKARYNLRFNLEHKDAEALFKEMKKLSKEVFIYLVRFGENNSKST